MRRCKMIDQVILNKEMPETEKNSLYVTTLSKIRWEDYEDKLIIHTPKEFSFPENLSYLKRYPNECLFEIVDDKIYRAISAGNETLF
jgi:DNA-3-methyladenine glycosylase II